MELLAVSGQPSALSRQDDPGCAHKWDVPCVSSAEADRIAFAYCSFRAGLSYSPAARSICLCGEVNLCGGAENRIPAIAELEN